MPSLGPVELAVLALLWLVPAFFVGRFAERRGRSFAAFFVLSLVFSWVIVLIALLVLTQPGTPDERPTPEQPVGAWGVTTGDDSFAGEHEREG